MAGSLTSLLLKETGSRTCSTVTGSSRRKTSYPLVSYLMRVMDQVPVVAGAQRVPLMTLRFNACPSRHEPAYKVSLDPFLKPTTDSPDRWVGKYEAPIRRPFPASIKTILKVSERAGSSPVGGVLIVTSHSPERLRCKDDDPGCDQGRSSSMRLARARMLNRYTSDQVIYQ
jgi:hypothetical protein